MRTLRMFATTLMMVVLCLNFSACSTDKEDVPGIGDEIQEIEVPSSDATNPVVAGQMLVIHGEGFKANSEIWIQSSTVTKAEAQGIKTEVMSVSENGISFITPKMSGQCDILLKQEGKSQTLGSVYMEERDLKSLPEYLYAIGGLDEDSPSLYKCNLSNGSFQEVSDLQKGDVIKFALSGTNGNGIVYYFQDAPASDKEQKVSLCSYDLKTNKNQVICSDWLTKFNNAATGQAIGMIEGSLCGVECSLEKGFEIIQFGNNGKRTLIKTFSNNKLVAGKEVIEFYCEDDNLLFNYDSSTKSVLVTGSIQFKGEEHASECLLSLNIKTGEIKMIRDEQDVIRFQTLNTGTQMLLLETNTEIDETTIKTINPETLESGIALGVVKQYILNPVYNEQSNSICWEKRNQLGHGHDIMTYSLATKEVSTTTTSLPYIETLFSIRY